MSAGTLTLSTFEGCHYQVGRTDAPELQARGVIQVTAAPEAGTVELRVTLTGKRKHQHITVVVPMQAADIDGLIHQMKAMRDMLAHGGNHGA